jgi:hypothetical protein
MRIEAILSAEDLAAMIREVAPLTVHFGKDEQLELTDPSEVTLVADAGLRVVCKGRVQWRLLGIGVPITLNSLHVLIRPEIVQQSDGNALVFTIEIEHADLSGIPTMIDSKITDVVNKALAEKRVELVWNFTETLSHRFKMPDAVKPLEAIAFDVCGGRLKIGREALVLAIEFRSAVTHGLVDEKPGGG